MAIDRNLVQGSMAMMILRLLETKDMYGYEMIEALRERSNNVFELKAGTLYPLLHSLESRGDVVSYGQYFRQDEKILPADSCRKKACGRKEEGMAGIPDCSFRSVESSERVLIMGKEEKRVVLAAHEEAEQPAAEENTDWRNAGSIRDYLDAIGEQIENPHARCAIRREIGNHIEEQTEDYHREGMTPLAAAQEAVRQMGDPLQTGRELNRIHRPKFPTVLFGITVILTLVGIVMQGILFSHMETVGAENYLRNTILYNGIGLLLILGLLYGNYMKLVRFSYGLTALFIAAGLAGSMLGTHMWSGSYHDRYEAVYLLWMFLPVLYALLLYRMRTLSWKVILILDAVYLAAVLLLSQDITCSAGMMEAFLLSIVILFLAIKRGILPGKKRLLYLAADGLPDGKRGDRLYCQQYSAGTAWLFIVGRGKDQ